MASLNRVTLIGNLGRDPETRYSQSGSAVCSFSVATTEKWNDKQGQKQEETTWHRIVTFGKLAEICDKYLKKGSSVYIEGRIKTGSYEKDGQTHYTTDINASSVQFLGGADKSERQEPRQTQGQAPQGQGYNPPPAPDDDIPF